MTEEIHYTHYVSYQDEGQRLIEECSSLEDAIQFATLHRLQNYYIGENDTPGHTPVDDVRRCPNSHLNWHGSVELLTQEDSRGQYFFCKKCGWYTGIEQESKESYFSQVVFMESMMDAFEDFKGVVVPSLVEFRSELVAEDPWHTLQERQKRYGNSNAADLELVYRNQTVTKFELKGWKNYTEDDFYLSKRAYVNIGEVQDTASTGGYICFITLKDSRVICTRAEDIQSEWRNSKKIIPSSADGEIKKRTLAEFDKGTLVVKAPDKQGNLRFVLSEKYKRKHCKYLKAFTPEIVAKIMQASNQYP